MFHPRGISALVSAICKNKRALISMLLNSGAEVNFVDIRRSQVLYITVSMHLRLQRKTFMSQYRYAVSLVGIAEKLEV